MNNLACYYESIKDYHNAVKYYLMAFAFDDKSEIDQILLDKNYTEHKILLVKGLFQKHGQIFNDEKYATSILFILEQHIDKEDIDDDLVKIISHINIKYFTKCSKLLLLTKKILLEKIELIELHFNYAPDSKGCQEAKNDFIERLV